MICCRKVPLHLELSHLYYYSPRSEMRTFLSQSRALFIHSNNHSRPKYVHNRPWEPYRWATRWRDLNAMATSATTQALHTFVIWAPDYTDEEAFSRRLAVREQHLVNLKARGSYVTKIAGPFLTPESIATPDAPKKLVGSMLLVRATSLEEVRSNVELDVYWTNDVWDKEKLVIAPISIDADNL